VADRVVLLHQGRVHAVGTPVDVLTDEHLSEVYRLPIRCLVDPETGAVRVEAQGRHHERRR
jgi:ferric hydroxamate transport system ATP-binding protein